MRDRRGRQSAPDERHTGGGSEPRGGGVTLAGSDVADGGVHAVAVAVSSVSARIVDVTVVKMMRAVLMNGQFRREIAKRLTHRAPPS